MEYKTVSATYKMSQGIAELERCFLALNEKFYNGKLPLPIITVQTSGTKKQKMGWFFRESWKANDEVAHEINICPEFLDLGIDETMNTLLHEMVHYDNYLNKIKDTSANGYHNKKFREAAEAVGLEVIRTRKGYNGTKNTPIVLEAFKEIEPNEEILSAFRNLADPLGKKNGSKLKKWSCGCTNLRVAVPDLEATCNKCGNEFEIKE